MTKNAQYSKLQGQILRKCRPQTCNAQQPRNHFRSLKLFRKGPKKRAFLGKIEPCKTRNSRFSPQLRFPILSLLYIQYTDMHIHIYICTYTYIYICIYLCVYVFIHVYMYIYTVYDVLIHLHRSTSMRICMCVYIYIYVYIIVPPYLFLYIYIYTHVKTTDVFKHKHPKGPRYGARWNSVPETMRHTAAGAMALPPGNSDRHTCFT